MTSEFSAAEMFLFLHNLSGSTPACSQQQRSELDAFKSHYASKVWIMWSFDAALFQVNLLSLLLISLVRWRARKWNEFQLCLRTKSAANIHILALFAFQLLPTAMAIMQCQVSFSSRHLSAGTFYAFNKSPSIKINALRNCEMIL